MLRLWINNIINSIIRSNFHRLLASVWQVAPPMLWTLFPTEQKGFSEGSPYSTMRRCWQESIGMECANSSKGRSPGARCDFLWPLWRLEVNTGPLTRLATANIFFLPLAKQKEFTTCFCQNYTAMASRECLLSSVLAAWSTVWLFPRADHFRFRLCLLAFETLDCHILFFHFFSFCLYLF